MQPLEISTRTRGLFGRGVFEQLGDHAAKLGERALLVSDPGLVAAGYPNRAFASLMRAGVEAHLFDGVAENPTTEHVESGVAFAREKRVDLIVGLGGGSAMDCAKGINFLLTNGGQMEDYWGVGKASEPMLPLIAIPTTAGTGSEAQSFALISNPRTHAKMACGDPKAMARLALLDPELTITQPAAVTAATGIDAVTHALESFVSTKRSDVSQSHSREAWRRLKEAFPVVLEQPQNLDARGEMMLGAHYAGAAIEESMLGAAHACANPLTARYGTVHGEAVGVMLPAVIRFNASAVGELYDELGGAETLASTLEDFLKRAGLPTRLRDHSVDEAAITELAREASKQWTARFNPKEVDEALLEEIYRCVY